MKTQQTESFWQEFAALAGVDADYDVVAFGDSAQMSDELAQLVLIGQKRATAGLLRDFEIGGEPLPVEGGFVVMIDGQQQPRAIWQTTQVRVGPLSSVDEAFAWDEGEGDRTRDDWLRMHTDYFVRQAQREGFRFHDDIETVFERFRIVWPLDVADEALN